MTFMFYQERVVSSDLQQKKLVQGGGPISRFLQCVAVTDMASIDTLRGTWFKRPTFETSEHSSK